MRPAERPQPRRHRPALVTLGHIDRCREPPCGNLSGACAHAAAAQTVRAVLQRIR